MPNHCGHPTGDFYELEAKSLMFDPDGDDDLWDYDAFLSDYANYLLSIYEDEEAFYQSVSDRVEDSRHYFLVKDYEFQERGGLLPGDTVSANIYPGYWQPGIVLLVGDKTVIVACNVELESGELRWECFEVNLDQATWQPEYQL